ncbi:MAG TPA: formyltetrahydrofolate deformylase [Verrucomicrobiales bacterium]|nr:formyltetrahydrofolate deformylase [Verrucomicrobiales bacterium]
MNTGKLSKLAAQLSILLIDCPDQKGLVHKITGAILDSNLNIVSNGEFVDQESNRFFMRTELDGSVDGPELMEKLRSFLPVNTNIRLSKREKKSVIIMASGEPFCLGDLLLRQANQELPLTIPVVISNHPNLAQLAAKFSVPFECISHEGKSREEHESAILERIDHFQPDYIVLAKYMRILTPGFVSGFPNRILNIHHSFLPAFAGAKPYHQAFQRGVKIIGATAHFVNQDLDEGPIISQDILHVDHTHSALDMAQAGRDVEKIVLARALNLVLEERVFVCGNKTVIFS